MAEPISGGDHRVEYKEDEDEQKETDEVHVGWVREPLGYHSGFACDRSGQKPIVGNRYTLKGQNCDVCEAEYLKMEADEQATYERIPPTHFEERFVAGPHDPPPEDDVQTLKEKMEVCHAASIQPARSTRARHAHRIMLPCDRLRRPT